MKVLNKALLVLGMTVYLLSASAQNYENQFAKPLHTVLEDISKHFQIKLKLEVDTVGKLVPWADFRFRPYSLDESLTGVLSLFDYQAVIQPNGTYKIKNYEYMRRTPEDGEKMLDYLRGLYTDQTSWEARAACLRQEVRERLHMDELLEKRVENPQPILSKIRKYDGYRVQNFALETLPGYFVTGSIYLPKAKGKLPLILMPNGHWPDGRYYKDEQTRFATLARMGAICVSYDLFGWGESELMVGRAAHRTSTANQVQILNGISILDYMLTRKDVDASRIGVNGGSGGGSQVILLSLLDSRIAAACPTVMVSSHFDGGCPCESGMGVALSCGGTNNAELMAAFAPKPLLIVSDGKDWTATTPELEYPFIQRIYNFYQAGKQVSNVHLPEEGHDFGINKRLAVYAFFSNEFGLNVKMQDESRIRVEPYENLLSFGKDGSGLPDRAVRKLQDIDKQINKNTAAEVSTLLSIEQKAKKWTAGLQLNDPNKESRIEQVISKHLKAITDWHNTHPFTSVPAGINPYTGEVLSDIDREVIANSGQPAHYHEDLMSGLRKDLTEEQVEQILDAYTVGKVAFTLRGFKGIVPDMTPEEEAFIIKQLQTAREIAVDYKRMKAISAIFEIYKTKCEQHLIANGRNWRQLYKDFVKKIQEEKNKEKNP